jgi:hypothetical protein
MNGGRIYELSVELPASELGDTFSFEAEPEPEPAVSTSWADEPYPGGPMVKVKGFPRKLDIEKAPLKPGPDVQAYRRTVSRAGRWKWATPFPDEYTEEFARGEPGGGLGMSGVAGVQGQSEGEIAVSGIIGEATFNYLRSIRIPEGLAHAGEPAMDATAANLIDEAFQKFKKPPATGADVSIVEKALADYCRRSIANEPKLHYQQRRPMKCLGIPPENGFTADCSEHSTAAYFWAREATGVAVPDPNHSGYNGYGYTGTLVDNPRVSGSYRVGDLGIYGASTGSTEHVVTCYQAGDASSSLWCSHGSEAAPYAVRLHYRGDLLCVVRPGLVP